MKSIRPSIRPVVVIFAFKTISRDTKTDFNEEFARMRSQLRGDTQEGPARKGGDGGSFLVLEARAPFAKKFDSFISLLRRRNTEDFIIAGYGRREETVLRLDG